MNIIADRVKERISGSPGTSSTLTLSAAPTGFRRFSSVMSIGDTCYAVIENGAVREIGNYTYSAVNTLTRTSVLKRSNSDSLINVGANAFVFISYIADKAVYNDGSNRSVIGSAGIIFSDASVQTTAASSPEWGNIEGDITDQIDLSNVLGLKAPLASPVFTGVPVAPTASGGTNTTQIATTAFVNSAISSASYFTEFLDDEDVLEGITPIVPITLNQQPLYFNNLGDIYHSIGWGWSDYGIDGPVMRGFAGFGLGYGNDPAATILIQGDSNGITFPEFAGDEGILSHTSAGLLGTVTVGSGLSFSGNTLSNTLDLSVYLPLAGGTLTGDLLFTDATYDIGKYNATRPKDGFFSGSIMAGGSITAGTYLGVYSAANKFLAGYISGVSLASDWTLGWAPLTDASNSLDLVLSRYATGPALNILIDAAAFKTFANAAFPGKLAEKYNTGVFAVTVDGAGVITVGDLNEAWIPVVEEEVVPE